MVEVNQPDALKEHVPAWERLAADALEPNVFYGRGHPGRVLRVASRVLDGTRMRETGSRDAARSIPIPRRVEDKKRGPRQRRGPLTKTVSELSEWSSGGR